VISGEDGNGGLSVSNEKTLAVGKNLDGR
jgi:hypothetical protein